MLLHAMVSKDKFDELLDNLGFNEIKNVTMVETWDRGTDIPLITAQISPDRWEELAQNVQATPSLDNYIDNNYDRLDVIACSEAGWNEADNNLGLISYWVHDNGWL